MIILKSQIQDNINAVLVTKGSESTSRVLNCQPNV